MLFWFFFTHGFAQDCPDVPGLIASAWSAYEIAEIDDARAALDEAGVALSCQSGIVRRDTLLDLFRLTAQVALTLDNEPRMEAALERAVAVDARLEARPEAPFSPELQARWDAIAARLRTSLAEIRVTGDGEAWVDGRLTNAANPLRVARGLHLVQTKRSSQGFSSEVVLVAGDYVIPTAPREAPVAFRPPPEPTPPVIRRPEPLPVPPPENRGRKTRAIVGGVGAAVFAGSAAFALSSGYISEQSFAASAYDGPVVPIYDVPRGDPIYPAARQEIIEFDARKINTLYGLGYASAALSAGFLTVAILPKKR